jgi:hypothetical protein
MVSKNNLPQEKPQNIAKHPPEWERDLNPTRTAGQNVGSNQPTEPRTHPASENKDVVRRLQDFDRDELQQIPIVETGEHLKLRATYVDLSDPRRRAFTVSSETEAGPDNHFVPKAGVAHMIWNRLVRVDEPYRKE